MERQRQAASFSRPRLKQWMAVTSPAMMSLKGTRADLLPSLTPTAPSQPPARRP